MENPNFERLKSALDNLLQILIESGKPVIITPLVAEQIIKYKTEARLLIAKSRNLPFLFLSTWLFFQTWVSAFQNHHLQLFVTIFLAFCTIFCLLSWYYFRKKFCSYEKILSEERQNFIEDIQRASLQSEIDELTHPGG